MLAGIGVVGVLELGILAFCLRCEDVLQLPFGKFLYGDLSPISTDTRFGKAFVAMTLGFAFVAALVYLAWLLERDRAARGRRSCSRSASPRASRSRGTTPSTPARRGRRELADWVHLSAASLWVGGLVALVAAVWPVAPRAAAGGVRALLAARGRARRARARGRDLPRDRAAAARCATSGRSATAQVLLVKLALVALVLAWGAFHHFVVRPRLAGAGDGFLARVGAQRRRRERRRGRGAARRRGARRLEAAAARRRRRRSRRPRGDESSARRAA